MDVSDQQMFHYLLSQGLVASAAELIDFRIGHIMGIENSERYLANFEMDQTAAGEDWKRQFAKLASILGEDLAISMCKLKEQGLGLMLQDVIKVILVGNCKKFGHENPSKVKKGPF